MQLTYLLFLACAAVATARATTGAQVITDLQDLNNQAQVVAKDIQNVQGGDISAELALQQEFTKTQKMVENTNSDAQNTDTISDAEAQQIVDTLKTLVDTVVNFLNDLDSKEEQFNSYEKSLILNDLKSVGASTQNLENTLHDKCPAAFQATAEELIQRTNDAFNTAIQTYSS